MRCRLDRDWWTRGQRWGSRWFHALAFVAWGFLVAGLLFLDGNNQAKGRLVMAAGIVLWVTAQLGEFYTRRRRSRTS